MTPQEELDAFLALHAVAVTVKPKGQYPREKKCLFRCSCGLESSDVGVVKGHAWQGHLFHKVNQKPWSES